MQRECNLRCLRKFATQKINICPTWWLSSIVRLIMPEHSLSVTAWVRRSLAASFWCSSGQIRPSKKLSHSNAPNSHRKHNLFPHFSAHSRLQFNYFACIICYSGAVCVHVLNAQCPFTLPHAHHHRTSSPCVGRHTVAEWMLLLLALMPRSLPLSVALLRASGLPPFSVRGVRAVGCGCMARAMMMEHRGAKALRIVSEQHERTLSPVAFEYGQYYWCCTTMLV